LVAFASSESPLFQKPLPANVRPVPVDIPRDSRLVTSAGGLSRFLRREGCCDANVFDRRENGTVPLAPPSGEKLIPTAAPAIATAQWTFTAELIGACRRQHRQLAVYLSIFLDEGRRLKRTQGLLFEPELRPATVAQGQYAREFLATVKDSLTAIRASELEPIHRAAGWLSEASAAKRKIVRNFQGHLPPKEAGTPGDAPFFSAMVSSMGEEGAAWIRSHLHAGDVYLLLGYQQNEDAMARAASALGARTIFLTSRRPGPQVAADPLHIDVNPHWPVTDACLDLPGYDVKACPLSAIAGLACYYAICAEAIRR
jgi:hypothetical protein